MEITLYLEDAGEDPDLATRVRYWNVPVELVRGRLSPAVSKVVLERAERGCRAEATAQVFARGGRFFALLNYGGESHRRLFSPLDCWAWENNDDPIGPMDPRPKRGLPQ